MKKFLTILILFLSFAIPVLAKDVLPAAKGLVTKIEYSEFKNLSNTQETQTKQIVGIKILTGQFKGQNVVLDNILTSNPAYDILLSKGNRVILHIEPKSEYVHDLEDVDIFIADIERENTIILFGTIFLILLILTGRKKGWLSFTSIFLTMGLIFFLMCPLILNGINPILSAILICLLATFITIYLVAGFNLKSTAAVLGTSTSLIFAGLLSMLAINMATLTGFNGEETMFLYTSRPDLNFSGILTASMMIAALGAVMDIGVSIASTINEIYSVNENLTVRELFTSGMNVGKDIIGTMSNTLILVYFGSSLPLLLLANNIDWVKFINLNKIATEVLSALIGSMAILICVPLTAIITAILLKHKYSV